MLALHHFAAAVVLPERAQLFSPEEIGWLREEAIGAARAGTLAGLHRSDAFGRLARHPRIVARVRAALGEDIVIAGSQLAPRGQLPAPAAGVRAPGLTALVDLGPSPQLRALDDTDTSGVVAFHANGSDQAGFGRLLFVIDYIPRPAGRSPLVVERDDALWPTPYTTAG